MYAILSWSRSVLAATPNRWLELTSSLPQELLVLPPLEGEWSATACLQHLLDTEKSVFPVRVQAIQDGRE